MKLIIAGSRTFTNYQLLCQTLAPERPRITQVITGGARGADQLGYRWAWKHQVKHQLFRADWERFGKSAGVRRNYQMAPHSPQFSGWEVPVHTDSRLM
jgi:YspA, cpYpsA-related SLOG family